MVGCDFVRATPLLYRMWSAARRADGGCDLVLEILIRDALISTSNLSAHGHQSNRAEIYTCISIGGGRTWRRIRRKDRISNANVQERKKSIRACLEQRNTK